MSIEIKFPEDQHMEIFSDYDNEKDFKKKLNELCAFQYGRYDAFVYTLFPTINNQCHTWKCSYEGDCESTLIYQKDESGSKYILKDINALHEHKSSYFKLFCQQKLRKKIGDLRVFTFPNNIQTLSTLEDEDEIRATLENQWSRVYPNYILGFTVRKIYDEITKIPQLFFQCKYKDDTFLDHKCEWHIIFQIDNSHTKWVLEAYNIHHEHFILMEKKDIFRSKKNNQKGFPQTSMAELTGNASFPKHKYGQRFIEGYNKIFQEPERPLYEVLKLGLKSVRKYHMEIRYKNRNELLSNDQFVDIQEDLLVISSKMMKFMSKSYGKVVYMKKCAIYQNQDNYDEKTKKKEDVYSIIMFYGFNHGYNEIVFGFAVIRNFTTEKGVRILDKFKNNYLHTLQALVVSQDDEYMKKVVSEYPSTKKTFHICIRDIPKNTYLEHFINDASKGHLEVQVQKYLMVGQNELQETIFEDQSAKHWFTSYNQCFLGLDFSLTGLKQLDEETVREVAGDSNITTFQYQFQHLIREANSYNEKWYLVDKQKSHFEAIFMGRDDVKKCRLMMGKKSFEKLIQQLLLVPTVNLLATDSETFYLIGDQSYPYIVCKKNQKWQCECEHSIKTGIGCVHELKVHILKNSNIFEAINMFWIMDQATINLEPNPEKANNPSMSKKKRRSGRKKLIA